MSVIKATIAPICSILVMSIIVLVMNSKNKKSLTTIITTVTTANIPLVIASVVSILTIFGSSISTITIPFTKLCSAVSIVLMYFTLKSIFGEEKNSEFIKKFALVELVYYIAYIVFSLLNKPSLLLQCSLLQRIVSLILIIGDLHISHLSPVGIPENVALHLGNKLHA